MIGPIKVKEISYDEIIRYRHWYEADRLPLANGHYDRLADFAGDRRHFYAAHLDGRVAGFSALSRHRRRPDGRDAIYQRSSYTRREYRRRGVWSAIWDYKVHQINSRAWARPETLIWVRTRSDDRRYERRGFHLEREFSRVYLGAVEPFSIWTISWSELLAHPTTARDLLDDVSVHTPEPLQVRL